VARQSEDTGHTNRENCPSHCWMRRGSQSLIPGKPPATTQRSATAISITKIFAGSIVSLHPHKGKSCRWNCCDGNGNGGGSRNGRRGGDRNGSRNGSRNRNRSRSRRRPQRQHVLKRRTKARLHAQAPTHQRKKHVVMFLIKFRTDRSCIHQMIVIGCEPMMRKEPQLFFFIRQFFDRPRRIIFQINVKHAFHLSERWILRLQLLQSLFPCLRAEQEMTLRGRDLHWIPVIQRSRMKPRGRTQSEIFREIFVKRVHTVCTVSYAKKLPHPR
jgi:hypothetical protein